MKVYNFHYKKNEFNKVYCSKVLQYNFKYKAVLLTDGTELTITLLQFLKKNCEGIFVRPVLTPMKYLIRMKLKCFNIQHTSLNLKSQTIGGNKNLSTTITAIHVDEHLNSSVQYTYICIYVLKSAVGT